MTWDVFFFIKLLKEL